MHAFKVLNEEKEKIKQHKPKKCKTIFRVHVSFNNFITNNRTAVKSEHSFSCSTPRLDTTNVFFINEIRWDCKNVSTFFSHPRTTVMYSMQFLSFSASKFDNYLSFIVGLKLYRFGCYSVAVAAILTVERVEGDFCVTELRNKRNEKFKRKSKEWDEHKIWKCCIVIFHKSRWFSCVSFVSWFLIQLHSMLCASLKIFCCAKKSPLNGLSCSFLNFDSCVWQIEHFSRYFRSRMNTLFESALNVQ